MTYFIAQQNGRKTPMHTAVEHKNMSALIGLLDRAEKKLELEEELEVSGGMYGETPLMYAVYKNGGWPEGVEYLISRGADVNANKGMQRTCLMLAGEFGRTEIAQLLIAKNADATTVSLHGRTAADWAKEYNHTELAEKLGRLADSQTKYLKSTTDEEDMAPPRQITGGV